MFDYINKILGDYFKKDLETMIQGRFKPISNLGGIRCWDNTNFILKKSDVLNRSISSFGSDIHS